MSDDASATPRMLVRGLLPWFGSKRGLAPRIVELLGPHAAYFEPFCGSAAVLFRKPRAPQETINDLHGDLVNLARVVAGGQWEELYTMVDRFLLSEQWLADLRDQFLRDCSDVPGGHCEEGFVERAARYLALSWMCRNGVTGTKRIDYSIAVRWTQGGGSSAKRWESVVLSIPAWHERLRCVVILRRDAFELIDKIPDEEATAIYVDPPYVCETRSGGGGSEYYYDFRSPSGELFGLQSEHERLAEALARFSQTRVVVSYYDCPEVRELYRDKRWTIHEETRDKKLARQNERGAERADAPELLIVNE